MKIHRVLICLSLLFSSLPSVASRADICCQRDFDSEISVVKGPGTDFDISSSDINDLKTSADSGFTYKGPQDADCPIELYIVRGGLVPEGPEYLLDCELQQTQAAGIGDHFVFSAKLIDPHHGNAIIAGPKEYTWLGRLHGYIKTDPGNGVQTDHIQKLVMSLRPFDDKIYEYERIPQACKIQPEKEQVYGGETISILISEIKDHKGRPSQPFQRIMVKVDIGRIKNGVNKHPYYVFAVPPNGAPIEIVYQAPEKCDFDTEIVTVYNSCERITPLFTSLPENEIGSAEIKVDDLLPVSCRVETEKDELEPGADTTIRLTDFKESEERPLGPGEKILVQAVEGHIANGEPRHAGRLFEIGNGTVEVEYQVPDLCGLDSDTLVVYSVCEDEDPWAIKEKKEISRKQLKIRKVSCDLSVNIKAVFQWQEDRGDSRTEGNATIQIRGSMKFDDSMEMPFIKQYKPEKMAVGWSMKEKNVELQPDPGCPELNFEYMGSGSASIPDPSLAASSFFQIHRLGDLFPKDMPIAIPKEAQSQLVDSFQLVLGGVKQTLGGKRRAGTSCGEKECLCKEYDPKEKKITVGTVVIRGKLDHTGAMKGNHYWVARGYSLTDFGFTINEVGEKIEYKPKPLEKESDSVMNVSVSWEIRAYH